MKPESKNRHSGITTEKTKGLCEEIVVTTEEGESHKSPFDMAEMRAVMPYWRLRAKAKKLKNQPQRKGALSWRKEFLRRNPHLLDVIPERDHRPLACRSCPHKLPL